MLADLVPGLVAALGFGASNVFGKISFAAGADVLTLLTFRGFVGIAFVWAWLHFSASAVRHAPRQRSVALGLGLIFAGNVYCVFKAIEAIPVPIAVLAYFIYPFLTGIGGAITGLDRLTWRGALAAFVAFCGLALMISAQPGELGFAGLAYAFCGALCRAALLLITRAELSGADSRLTTGYSLLSSTLLFVLVCLATQTWNLPQTAQGWSAFLATSVATTVAIVALFASTARIGPFRTALTMNLEPVVSTALSMLLLGETMQPIQVLGAVVMIAALCAFQLRR